MPASVQISRSGAGQDKREGPAAIARCGALVADRGPQTVSSTARLRVRFGSTGMPGPIVVEKVTFFR